MSSSASALGALLSIQPTKPKPPNNTSRHTEANSPRSIGSGSCGRIYAADNSCVALKVAHSPSTPDPLWNEYVMHTHIWEAVQKLQLDEVRVPQPRFYVPGDESAPWWQRHAPMFAVHNDPSEHFAEARPVLAMERIHPLSDELRLELIRTFGQANDYDPYRTQTMERPGNRDCLVRAYLGSSRQRQRQQGGGAIGRCGNFFSLRNLKLRLDQMEEMGMATEVLAAQVAGALATMHWEARVDGRGVEFVLGSVPPPPAGPREQRLLPLAAAELEGLEPGSDTEALVQQRAAVCLWLLDFDQCGNMSMDDKGVERAVEAFCGNEPYYPRPVVDGEDGDGKDARLWKGFCARYLEISDRILLGTGLPRYLPRLMLESIEAHYREKARLRSAEAEIH